MTALRHYETTYILAPDTTPEDRQKISDRVSGIIESFQGEIRRIDDWGKRRLAYPIGKHSSGLYIYNRFVAAGDVVAELERQLRIADGVIKFLTVKLDPRAPEVSTLKEVADLPMDADGDDDEDDD